LVGDAPEISGKGLNIVSSIDMTCEKGMHSKQKTQKFESDLISIR